MKNINHNPLLQLPWDIITYVLSFDNRFVINRITKKIRFIEKIKDKTLHQRAMYYRPLPYIPLPINDSPDMTYVILPIRFPRYFEIALSIQSKEIQICCIHETGNVQYDLVTYDVKGHVDSEPLLLIYD
jgi:hypothetical protein